MILAKFQILMKYADGDELEDDVFDSEEEARSALNNSADSFRIHIRS